MGLNLKDIFKNNSEEITVNRSKNAIRALIYLAGIVIVVIIGAVILKNWSDKDEIRRMQITQDSKVIKSAVINKANEYMANPTTVTLIGTSLVDSPITINQNGIDEEYRYGYYYLDSKMVYELTTAIALKDESYIINYDTFDVINYNGVKYEKNMYYDLEDLIMIEQGNAPKTKQIIRTASDLEKIRQNPNGYFKLSGNIDLSEYNGGEGFKPIEQFGGTLDGRGYTISNLTISRPSSKNVGFFSELLSTATITNIKFENVNIRGGEYVGTLAGTGAGTISHVEVLNGSLVGQTNYCGGLVGSQNNGTISDCKVFLDSINANAAVGGLVGISYSGTISRSGAKTYIVARDSIGGIIGTASVSDATFLEEVCANCAISGVNNLGGLIGKMEVLTDKRFELANSYAKGSINGTVSNAGGLVGSISSISDANLAFNYLFTTVSIVNKNNTTGGCIGLTDIKVTSSVVVNNCYWEKDLLPGEVLYSVGEKKDGTFILSFDNKTPEEMKIKNGFINWDFSIWGIYERESTPYLKWEV